MHHIYPDAAAARAAIINTEDTPSIRLVPAIEVFSNSEAPDTPTVPASNTVEYNEGFKHGIQAALSLMGVRHAS